MIDVVVEIPKGSRNKYEFDPVRGVMRLDRRLFTATAFPGDYGFVDGTLGEDGDPVDALVLVDDATFPGCWVTARALGIFRMADEHGPDPKVICVPVGDPNFTTVTDLDQLPPHLLAEIEHFFAVYKALEPGKDTSIGGYEGLDAALEELDAGRARFGAHPPD